VTRVGVSCTILKQSIRALNGLANILQDSPDLSPPDYFLFPKVKLQLKGARFDTTEVIQKAVTDQLNKIPAQDFSNTMKKLETCANLCITSNESYFE